MKPNQAEHTPPDFDADLENDAVWTLLDDASHADPSPTFIQDTLRRIRLEKGEQKNPWWKSLLSPKPLLGISGAALAAVAIVVSLPSNPRTEDQPISNMTDMTENFNQLEDTFATELLSGAAEDPTLLSDEEIVALLY